MVPRHAPPRLPLLIALALLSVGFGAGITGCSSLPTLEGRTMTSAIGAETGTRLHDSLAPLTEQHPGLTGIYALGEGRAAFAARVALAEAAQRSLDVQYYIWHEDVSGKPMLDALRRAADRGVRVRLLLDDNNTKGMDPTLAALNAHANVELRVQPISEPLGTRVELRHRLRPAEPANAQQVLHRRRHGDNCRRPKHRR